ncbi:MAG: YIP1 family protein [Bacteroidota bacterium]
MASWVDRVIGAAMLRSDTYEEVEADHTANFQALGVVLLSAIAGGLSMANAGGPAIAVGIVTALIGWVLWAGLTWLIGTKFLPTPETKSDMGELLRTTGFAAAPGFIRVLGAIPLVGFVFTALAGLWMLAAFVVAVRQALDYRSTMRALAVCLIGALVWFSVIAWSFFLLGASAVGIQALQGKV